MEFLDNSTKTVPFSEIKVGGIFKVNDNYYMKITQLPYNFNLYYPIF